MKTLIIISSFMVGMLLAGCGAEQKSDAVPDDSTRIVATPTPTPTPIVPTPTPTPVPIVTKTFTDYLNQAFGICQALSHFDPNTEIIVFPIGISSTTNYSFEKAGVFTVTVGGVRSVASNTSTGNGQCTFHIVNGQFTGL